MFTRLLSRIRAPKAEELKQSIKYMQDMHLGKAKPANIELKKLADLICDNKCILDAIEEQRQLTYASDEPPTENMKKTIVILRKHFLNQTGGYDTLTKKDIEALHQEMCGNETYFYKLDVQGPAPQCYAVYVSLYLRSIVLRAGKSMK